MPKGSVNYMSAPITQKQREAEAMDAVMDRRNAMLAHTDYYAPTDVENFGPAIADIASYQGIPMPAPVGKGGVYLPHQYTDLVGQYYMAPADAAVKRQAFMDRFRQSMTSVMPGAAPILPQGFQRLPDATFAGGRDYAVPQGPEYEPGFLNRLRAMLGY